MPLRRLQLLHHSRHRRLLEQNAQGQIHRERLPHPRDHLRCQQRVSAQLKKVLFNSCSLYPQHLLPNPTYNLFLRASRAPLFLYPSSPFLQLFHFHPRQTLAIHLSIRRQRQFFQLHIHSWHHIFRQLLPQLLPQLSSTEIPAPFFSSLSHSFFSPHDVSNQDR